MVQACTKTKGKMNLEPVRITVTFRKGIGGFLILIYNTPLSLK